MLAGGDEVNAVVLEVGSHWTKAGYAGEDMPRAAFASVAATTPADTPDGQRVQEEEDAAMDVDTTELRGYKSVRHNTRFHMAEQAAVYREGVDLRHALKDGLVHDWDVFEQLVEYAFLSHLRADLAEHPLMLCEPPHATKEHREKAAQIAFESYNTPAFFLAKNPVLTAFASGKSTALVLDCGAGVTTVTAVYDGYALQKSVQSSAMAGDFLTSQCEALLKETLNLNLTPIYKIARKRPVEIGKPSDLILRKLGAVKPSFDDYCRSRMFDDFKETTCSIPEMKFNEAMLGSRTKKAHEFPDGIHYNFGSERFRIGELLFNPREFAYQSDTRFDTSSFTGLHHMVEECLKNVDVDLKPMLLANMVVAGGTTLLNNFSERLTYSLANTPSLASFSKKLKFTRLEMPWSDGSVVGWVDPFWHLWERFNNYGFPNKNGKNPGLLFLKKGAVEINSMHKTKT